MSAYLWAVQIGMPEGLSAFQQQLWLHKWKLSQEATCESQLAAKNKVIKRLEQLYRSEALGLKGLDVNVVTAVEYQIRKAKEI